MSKFDASGDFGRYRSPTYRAPPISQYASCKESQSKVNHSQQLASTHGFPCRLKLCSWHRKASGMSPNKELPIVSRFIAKRSLIPVPRPDGTGIPAFTSVWSCKNSLSTRLSDSLPSTSCEDGKNTSVPRLQPKKPLYPMTESELRTGLEDLYCSFRKQSHGILTRIAWLSGTLNAMTRIDYVPPQPLDDRLGIVHSYCNKPNALYWASAAQVKGRCPMLLSGCIYKHWYRYFSNNPRLDFHHFFAKPFQITPTGPQMIRDIEIVHKSLCDQVLSIMDSVIQDGADRSGLPDPRHYRFFPMYRAVLLIVDNYDPAPDKEAQQYFVLDDVSKRQSVIIVLTGDDCGLSVPLTFESIRGQSLPLEREDAEGYEPDRVIRVPLLTALHFILDLEQREEIAFPDPYMPTDRSIGPRIENQSFGKITASDWAEEVLQKVRQYGLANVQYANRFMEEGDPWPEDTVSEAKRRGNEAISKEFIHFDKTWI